MSHSTSDAYMIEGRDRMIDEYEDLFHSAREMREAQARYRQARERVEGAKGANTDPAYAQWSDQYDHETAREREGK